MRLTQRPARSDGTCRYQKLVGSEILEDFALSRHGRSQYRPWAELLKRTFASDLEKCSRCGGRLKLRALVKRPASIRRYLRHLGESPEAPPLAPARDPPYFKSRALRRKLGELEEQPSQVELFAS